MLRDVLPSRGPLAMLAAGGAALGLYLLAMVMSFVDPSFAGGDIGRNTTFDGASVSGIAGDELDGHIDGLTAEFDQAEVRIDAGYGATSAPASALGLDVDIERSADAVRSANSPALLTRPFEWVGSFFTTTDVEPRYHVDESVMNSALVDLDLPGITEWSMPSIETDADGVRVVPGVTGTGIATETFGAQLIEAAETQDVPLLVAPDLVDIAPPISDADAKAAADEAAVATSTPLEVTVADLAKVIDVATLRSWLVLDITDDGGDHAVDWDLDHPLVQADLAERFAEVERSGSDVQFVVEGGQLAVVEGEQEAACCEEDSSERIESALRSRAGRVELELITEETGRGPSWAESLGIVEEVASFTTNHPCCQNRVVNIQLMADAIRGVVIEPGQTFSLNDHVGRRTAEKGYLPAGGITNGVVVDQLGGGVSQLTTTLFNAAFFAGLDFGEYQAHSIYFSRYPYGREATLSYPAPDLQIRNTTPYGVLVWPTYTDTSITITLYSTEHVEVEQSGQTTSAQGVCTRVRTERTRTYEDGRTEVDAVFAVYRPREGVNCSGESSVPTTEPEPEEPVEPEQPPGGEEPPPESTTTTPPATTTSTTAPPATTTSTTSTTATTVP